MDKRKPGFSPEDAEVLRAAQRAAQATIDLYGETKAATIAILPETELRMIVGFFAPNLAAELLEESQSPEQPSN